MPEPKPDLLLSDVMLILGLSEARVWDMVNDGSIVVREKNDQKTYDRVSVYEQKKKRDDADMPMVVKGFKAKLTKKESAFIDSYLCHWSAQKAYVDAGYSKKANIAVNSWKVLHRPKIAAEIKARAKRLAKKKDVTQERVVEELRRIAFGQVDDVLEWDQDQGAVLKPSFLLDEEVVSTVQEVSTVNGPNGRNTKIKLYDKQRALEMLSKYLGIIDEGGVNINLNWQVEFVEPKQIEGEVVETETLDASDPDTN